MSQVSRDVIDYKVLAIDLTGARTDTLLNVSGKAITVLTKAGTWTFKLVKIDGTDGDVIDSADLTNGTIIGVDFQNIKFTNGAQGGVTTKFFVSK